MSSSQIFTIGTALRRAEDNGVPVEVLVEGQWLRGEIAGLDGDGLVLVTPERTQCVVRNAHISVVRILANLSFDDEAPSEPQATTYESTSTRYDAPRDWEPTRAADAGTAVAAAASSPTRRRLLDVPLGLEQRHRACGRAVRTPPASTRTAWCSVPRTTAGLGAAADDDGLVLGAAAHDDVLVLDAGDGGPRELGSGASWQAADVGHRRDGARAGRAGGRDPRRDHSSRPSVETPVETPSRMDEPVTDETPEAPEAEVIELRPEPVAADRADEPPSRWPRSQPRPRRPRTCW